MSGHVWGGEGGWIKQSVLGARRDGTVSQEKGNGSEGASVGRYWHGSVSKRLRFEGRGERRRERSRFEPPALRAVSLLRDGWRQRTT